MYLILVVSANSILHHFSIDFMHPIEVSVSVKRVAKLLVANVTRRGLLRQMFELKMPVDVTFLEGSVATVQANILALVAFRYTLVHQVKI